MPSPSAETLLVRKDGQDALYLNRLRHGSAPALTLRTPLTRMGTPAVKAALGMEGSFEGEDYRGVRVLADVRRVPGTDWALVTKVDADEILSDVRFRGLVILAFAIIGILLSLGLAAMLHSARQRRFYEKLAEGDARYRKLFDSSRDALMVIAGPTWRFRQANPATPWRIISVEPFEDYQPGLLRHFLPLKSLYQAFLYLLFLCKTLTTGLATRQVVGYIRAGLGVQF